MSKNNDEEDDGVGFDSNNFWEDYPYFMGHYDDDNDEYEDINITLPRRINIIIIGLLVLLLLGFYALYNFIPIFINSTWEETPVSFSRFIITLLILAMASGLYWLRENIRVIYGLMELAFSIITTWVSVGLVLNNNEKYAIVIASMYLFVRGLDNYKRGFKIYKQKKALDTDNT